MIPIRTDSPLRTRPWVNWLLVAANVVVFLLQVLVLSHRGPQADARYVLNPRDPHLINFFTYAFLHANTVHLIGNMLALYIFGNNVNDKLGQLGYLAFYLAGAVFAGIGFIATTTGASVLGASGAVGAVMGAYLALLPRSNVTLIYIFVFIGVIEIPSMYFIIFYFLFNIFMSLSGPGAIAYQAHVAGMAFGFGVGMLLLALSLVPRNQFDFLALIQRWNRRRQYQTLVRQGYDPFGYIPVQPDSGQPQPVNPHLDRIQELRAAIGDAMARHDLPAAAALYQEMKRLDPRQVLLRQTQLDIANQLASQQAYADAADAYEVFLQNYANFEQIEQVQLMLGLIYARYLGRYDRAKALLTQALTRLHGDRETQLARAELSRIEPLILAQKPPA